MTALSERLRKIEVSQNGSQAPHWDGHIRDHSADTMLACEATLELCKTALLDRLPDIKEGDDTSRALEAVIATLKILRRQA